MLLSVLPNMENSEEIGEHILNFGEQFVAGFNNLLDGFKENSGFFIWNILVAIIIVLAARGGLALISHFTKTMMRNEKYHRTDAQGKRIDTLMTLLRSVARYVIYFTAALMILSQFGVNGAGGLAMALAGIGSFALGFGAKDLVQDVVTGLFIMFENQFSVGDYIKTDEAEGTVEATAMRVTYLRSMKGDQIIIPNGSITRVINYTRGGYIASVTVSTAYEADTRQVIEVLNRAVAAYAIDHADLIEKEPVVLGVSNLNTSSVDIGVVCKARPMKQWEVERGMRLAIKEEFDRSGIEFPYPRLVTISAPTHTSKKPVPIPADQESPPQWASVIEEEDAYSNSSR